MLIAEILKSSSFEVETGNITLSPIRRNVITLFFRDVQNLLYYVDQRPHCRFNVTLSIEIPDVLVPGKEPEKENIWQ